MRKTILWDKKEPTAEYCFPIVTRIGRKVSMKHKRKSNLSRADRFPQYRLDEKRVGPNVGPGSYSHRYQSIDSYLEKPAKFSTVFYRHKDLSDSFHYYRDFSTGIPNFQTSPGSKFINNQ